MPWLSFTHQFFVPRREWDGKTVSYLVTSAVRAQKCAQALSSAPIQAQRKRVRREGWELSGTGPEDLFPRRLPL